MPDDRPPRLGLFFHGSGAAGRVEPAVGSAGAAGREARPWSSFAALRAEGVAAVAEGAEASAVEELQLRAWLLCVVDVGGWLKLPIAAAVIAGRLSVKLVESQALPACSEIEAP